MLDPGTEKIAATSVILAHRGASFSDGENCRGGQARERGRTWVCGGGEPLEWRVKTAVEADIGLPGRQQELFDAVCRTGKPVVVILFNGGRWPCRASRKKARRFGSVVSACKAPMGWPTCCLVT